MADTHDKTLREHLAEALAKRWENTSEEQRTEHSAKMNKARWPNGAKKKSSTGEGKSYTLRTPEEMAGQMLYPNGIITGELE